MPRFPSYLAILFFVTLSGATAHVDSPAPIVDGLRCGGLVDPLGLDDAAPALSWRLESPVRGAAQTAFRVLVASSREILDTDRGDLWDTGRVDSSENLRLAYGGAALHSSQTVYWKTRVWDQNGQASAWSAPGTWTAGVLHPADWAPGTRWISDPALLRWRRVRLGFRSRGTPDPSDRKWIQLDLGATVPVESVRLYAVRHTVDENLGFPLRYELELADRADFSDRRIAAVSGDQDARAHPGVIDLNLAGASARYVRFTATKLRVTGGEACLAFSQVEVISGGSNIAPAATVSASDTVEDAQWSVAALTDRLGEPGANPRASDSLRLRRGFDVRPGLRRALLQVSGLGHYTLAVNGTPVGAGLLTPGWTDYRQTCLYDTLNLTAELHPGANALGLTLAGGMYNVQDGFGRYVKFVSPFRPLEALGELRLDYSDGTTEVISTDGKWTVAPGAETYANIFGGEDHDARRDLPDWAAPGFDDSTWTKAAVTDGPGGVLRGAASAAPPLVAHETLPPAAVRELAPGTSVYDFGQNAAMMPRLRVHGPAGATVRMIPAELVNPDGSVNRGSVGGGLAYWQYTLRGDPAGEAWFPSFFYQGARYLQVVLAAPPGLPRPVVDRLESVVVYSDSPPAGEFACANGLFNRIRTLVRWAQCSNLTHVLSDCPHRERLGWLEQYHLNGPALRYEWDLGRLFAKGFNDMEDAQRADGLVPSIAPQYVVFDGGFVDSPEWGSAIILAAWQHYVFTGDDAPLRRHFGAMQRYFDYLTSRADQHIVSHGLGDWYDLGPRRPGVAQLTPIALTATAIYCEDAQALARIATCLGRSAEAARYGKMAGKIGAAFNAKFFHPATGRYADGSQTAQAMPLVLGLVAPEHRAAVVAALVNDIAAHGNGVTAGDVGYRYVLRALAAAGRSDVVYAMNNQSERPGYGYQLAHGATALTEAWNADPNSSQNHFMLGQVTEWFYQDLAGLGVDPSAPGFKHIIFRPTPVAELAWAEASHISAFGPVKIRWETGGGEFRLNVTVPPNATATVYLPARSSGTARESGRPAGQSAGVKFLGHEDDRDRFEIVAGTYSFVAAW